MAELRPYPFGALVTRMFRELEREDAIFHLPRSKFFLGAPDLDLSVKLHGHRASTPLGPAAGPQSQMAQNIVLSWLGGARIHELKTVQVDDELTIPRPCIDMQTVGYNVEWSQELRLEQSLEEYVKGAMLVEILIASGKLALEPGMARTLYDMSVGYGLVGLRTDRVQAFIRGMLDCVDIVDRLRGEIPLEFAELRDVDFPKRLSNTLTLSTFHGCPPEEIEAMIDFLLHENGLHCIVKLNPMLLGPTRARELLHDALGYKDLRIPDSAFERDTKWDRMEGFVERLGETATSLGLGFGVKFTNTLIVENHRDFFPESEKEMYLSGAPLHVLAMDLVGAFRKRFGDRYPISFSAGIDRRNFADAVAIGLVPVTVCSDLLKPGGYARARGYFDVLRARMAGVGATSVDGYVLRAYGLGEEALDGLGLEADAQQDCTRAWEGSDELLSGLTDDVRQRWLSATKLLNTNRYVNALPGDESYHQAANAKPPRKIGSELELFDCVTCDKCVPVCPNDANFTFVLPAVELPIVKLHSEGGDWRTSEHGTLTIAKQRQYANFADFCNDCGNCDVFCPEEGGPYLVKPRFFGSLEDWRTFAHLDGFHLDDHVIRGRFEGREYSLVHAAKHSIFAGEGFELRLVEEDPLHDLEGTADAEVDLTYLHLLAWIRDAVYAADGISYPALLGRS